VRVVYVRLPAFLDSITATGSLARIMTSNIYERFARPRLTALCVLSLSSSLCFAQNSKPAKAAPTPPAKAAPPQKVAPQSLQHPQATALPQQQHAGAAQPPTQLRSHEPQSHAPQIPHDAVAKPLPGGGKQYTDHSGRSFTTNTTGHVTEFHDASRSARFDSSGQVRFVQSKHGGDTTSVVHNFSGSRIVQTHFADGSRVVSYGPHTGFAERPVPGRAGYLSRTYASGGTIHVYVYRTRLYLGIRYSQFVPGAHYRPAFYAYVNSPWPGPVAYSWGTSSEDGVYGAYFTPYPVYSSPDMWLTDYMMNASLQQAYAERQESLTPAERAPQTTYSGAPAFQATLDPGVKSLIQQQVVADVAAMQTDSAQPNTSQDDSIRAVQQDETPDVLKSSHTVFVVSTDLQVAYGDEQVCALTAGDVLFRRPSAGMAADGTVDLTVVGTKAGSCNLNTPARLNVATLEEMNNQFEQQLQGGLETLAAKQKQGLFPPAPDTTQTQVAAGQDAPQDINMLLKQTQDSADHAEVEVMNGMGN
jgi:hypothetical protein